MSDDFDKSERKKTEVAIISRVSVKKRAGNWEVDESWSEFQDEIEKEIGKRPNMRLTNIQALDKAIDRDGNPVNHTLAYLLIFEEIDNRIDILQTDITDIRESIERMRRGIGA